MNAHVALEHLSYRKQAVLVPQERYSGYRALWLKVIVRAIFDWVCYRDSEKLEKRKIAEQAEAWLFDEDSRSNGLDATCLLLGISPQMVRERARCMNKDMVAKIEHLEREGDIDEAGELLLDD